MRKYPFYLFYLFYLFYFLLASCSSKLVEPLNTDPLSIKPSGRPIQNMTDFTKAVSCLDDLISDKVMDDIFITIDSLPNESKEDSVAESSKTMLHTALSNMGTRNNKIKVVDYSGASSENLATLMKDKHSDKENTKTISKKIFEYPEYYIKGGISQSEKGFAKKGHALGAEAGQVANIDVTSDEKASALALDLQVGYVDNLQLIPGVYSNNILTIIENEEEAGAGVAFMEKASIDYSLSYERKEGISAAIRSLIELGTVELIGKLLHLPYQECLTEEGRAALKNKLPQSSVVKSRQIDVSIGTQEKGEYKLKDDIVLNISLSENGYPRCYYKDEQNSISMIYPNQFQPKKSILGNQTLNIPDPDIKSFKLQITEPGEHEFMCMASNIDIENDLPSYLAVGEMKPINVTSLDKIISDVSTIEKTKGHLVGFSKKKIEVNK